MSSIYGTTFLCTAKLFLQYDFFILLFEVLPEEFSEHSRGVIADKQSSDIVSDASVTFSFEQLDDYASSLLCGGL